MARQLLPSHGTLTDLRIFAVELPAYKLKVEPPGTKKFEVALGMAPLVIGTDAECDVVLVDPRVSRKHCELRVQEGRVVVRDLGSKNGCQLDKVGVLAAFLEPKMRLVCGETIITLINSKLSSKVALSRGVRFGEAFGASVPMRALFANLERAAATDETIVLLGESGTGKELLARGIHTVSPRVRGPFAVFDCSTVAPNLLEAELFGYVRGAFTGAVQPHAGVFEQAHGGTLFIDELGELPLELQPKLLRAIEARQIRRIGSSEWQSVNVRIVAATHRDLRARVAAGTFREDLYYRLSVLEALVPPLRERPGDIPLLVEHFLAQQEPARTLADLPSNALDLLASHHWPGNVRELRNTVARLLLFPGQGNVLISAAQAGQGSSIAKVLHLPLREARELLVEDFERAFITAKLSETAGNVTKAAENMGVSRQFLHRLLERYGIGPNS